MADLEGYGVGSIIVIVVTALLVAALLPPAIGSATSADFSERTTTVQLTEGNDYNLSDVNATMTLNDVTSVGNGTANYTIANGGDSSTFDIEEGNDNQVTVNNVDYNVSVTSVDEPNNMSTAIVDYQVPNGGGVAADVWILVPIFIVLAPLLLFVGIAISGRDSI